MIDIAQILTAFVLLVVERRILSSFGNRKSVFVVRNDKNKIFSEIFDFLQNWPSNDNDKHILLLLVSNLIFGSSGMS